MIVKFLRVYQISPEVTIHANFTNITYHYQRIYDQKL